MKTASLLLATTVLASGVSVAAVHWVLPPTVTAARDDGRLEAENVRPAVFDRRLDRLEESLGNLQEKLAAREAPVREPVPRLDDAAIRAAVLAWLDKNGEKAPGLQKRAAEATGSKKHDLDEIVRRLRTGKLSWEEESELWASLAGEDRERLVQMFEKLARDHPYDAGIQVDLANAYLQKIQDTANPLEKGQLATKADQIFDKALEIDDHHWRARFSKAMSLSFWPDFMGKKPEAIRHFNVLIEQQESSPAKPEHVTTYLFLGNIYAQQGKDKQANEIWQRGLDRFPNDKALSEKLGR